MNDQSKKTPEATKVREKSIGWMLKLLCTRLDASMTRELKLLGLNISQFSILMTLLEKEGLSQSEIGKKITMPGYATTRSIDALEKMKLVKRGRDAQSRRSYSIYLTDKGHAVAPKLFKTVTGINESLLSPLDIPEQKQINIILQKLLGLE